MDVQRGFCWRCNEGPFKEKELSCCPKCSMAKYCSRRCQREDTVRHGSIECPTWSPKTCIPCKKQGARVECTGCCDAWYCNRDCQQRDRRNHKARCHQMRGVVRLVASKPSLGMRDYPFYFSNSFANDLLQLQQNEFGDPDSEDPRYTSPEGNDFRILLAATGDLRHVLKTMQSLPSSYRGRVDFVMNDIDPFAMARNILLLYMMCHLEKERASNIATIWLSSKISRDDYGLLQKSLNDLISTNPESLKTDLSDLIRVDESSWNSLREVWCGWKKLECRIGDKGCINLLEEKEAIFRADHEADSGLSEHIENVPQRHRSSIAKFRDGVIEPRSKTKYDLAYYNPTLTGRERAFSRFAKSPSEYQFRYCVRPDCMPYAIWDYLDMAKFKMVDSVTKMCHIFTVHVISTFMTAAQAGRLTIDIHVEDYINLSKVMGDHGSFDRIFSSNLIDFRNITDVLRVLEPFLSQENPHAVIMTETRNWTGGIENALIPSDPLQQLQLQMRHLEDVKVLETCGVAEYYDNMAYFINYLRGDKLAGLGVPRSVHEKLPTWRESMERGELVMRDIRKELNRVVPFNRRVHARAVNMLRGDVRTLEWYRKPE